MAINLPEKCLRNLSYCQPLGQIRSDCETSFVCCGLLDPSNRTIHQDRFRLCWKSQYVDETGEYDRRDIIDTISVLAQALSADENNRVSNNAG